MKRIAVLFGGCSSEYEVSLQSAYSVISSMDKEGYDPVLIGLKRDTGQWFWFRGKPEQIRQDCWYLKDTCIPVFPSMDRTHPGLCYIDEKGMHVLSLDAAFPILHGKNGEDGTVQGVFELMGVPVVGCSLLASALCMDKAAAHAIVRAQGIKTAESVVINGDCKEDTAREYAKKLGYPLFVKPVRAGSSYGITKVEQEGQLLQAIAYALENDDEVILEEAIGGFEVGCAIIGTKELIIGAVDEIELSDGFFDYTEKYTLKTSKIHVPARIPEEKAQEIKETALTIFRLLGCSMFARVDLFLTPSGEIYFNEVNTIPGFTRHSRFPNMLKQIGLSFEEVVGRLLEMTAGTGMEE